MNIVVIFFFFDLRNKNFFYGIFCFFFLVLYFCGNFKFFGIDIIGDWSRFLLLFDRRVVVGVVNDVILVLN